jgi:hypothetical protein
VVKRHARRRYYIVCYDGTVFTLDDFRYSRSVYPAGSLSGRSVMAEGDWFLLFDVASLTFRGHGQVIVGQRGGRCGKRPMTSPFTAALARKANRPLHLLENRLHFLKSPHNSRLLAWRSRGVSRISRRDFDLIFNVWWGIERFSNSLPR